MRAGRSALWTLSLGLLLCTSSFVPSSGAKPYAACPVAGERPLRVVHFYFGRAIKGRQALTDSEWTTFAAEVLSRNFPDGFTSYDGDGQWLSLKTGMIVRERSKIVIAAVQGDAALAARIRAVSDAYKNRFHQESVGVTTEDVCGAF